jgi:hypothetical protein
MSQYISINYPWATEDEGRAAFEEVLAQINDTLAHAGYPVFRERASYTPSRTFDAASVPSDWVWRLRRAASYAVERQPLVPWEKRSKAADDTIMEDAASTFSSHLIGDWGQSSVFVPVDFPDPLFLKEGGPRQGFATSTQGLVRDLLLTAPLLGIRVEADGTVREDTLAVIAREKGRGLHGPERYAWWVLYVLARDSIALGTAIVFH